jgi:hypothetical protein
MPHNRFFLNQPAGSRLEVTVVVAPPGSATAVAELAINGVPQGPQAVGPGIQSFPCPQPNSTYGVHIDLVWLAKGKVVVAAWLILPNGGKVLRPPVVLEGSKGAVDGVNILVKTT